MKRLFMLFFTALMLSACVCASELPFTDEDYLREDFGLEDYAEYVKDSMDLRGYAWPEGTKAIAWENYQDGGKRIDEKSDKIPLQVPVDIEIIGSYCFMGRKFPNGSIDFTKLTELRYIDKCAFRDTYLRDIDLSKTQVVRICESGFNTSAVNNFIAPKTLKRIDQLAFGAARCGLEYVELNEGLEYIGNYAFLQYSGNITIPSTVKYIGIQPFPSANVYVYKDTYAEKWCKDNGMRYSYAESDVEKADSLEDSPDIVHNVGPLKFTKYYTHSVSEREYKDIGKVKLFSVTIGEGGYFETLHDGVEIYMTAGSEFHIEGYEEQCATTSKQEFLSKKSGKVNLGDYGIIATPTVQLENGWVKGVKWQFNNTERGKGVYLCFVVEYKDVRYNYIIGCDRNGEYLKAKATPNYDKRGVDVSSEYTSSVVSYINPTSATVIVNGKKVNCEAYDRNGTNYFKMRDIAMMLKGSDKQFAISWNQKESAVEMLSNTPYAPIGSELASGDGTKKPYTSLCPQPVFLDGKEILLLTINIAGSNYIKLRDLAEVFDFGVTWDDTEKCIRIETDKSYT